MKSNTVVSSPPVRPQPPFNLTAVFTEGYNISWETIYQNPLFYFLNEELEYQLRYKRGADTWEVSEILAYHQVPAKRGPALAGQERWCGRRVLEVLKKILFCLPGLRTSKTIKRIEKQKLLEKYKVLWGREVDHLLLLFCLEESPRASGSC